MAKFCIFFIAAICVISFLVWMYPYFATRITSILILNDQNKDKLPKEFRITPLGASASSQFSKGSLQKMLELLQKQNVVIVDLREESHGFLNGSAISWFSHHNWGNQGKNKSSIIRDENEKIHQLSEKFFAFLFIHKTYPIPYRIKSAMTERELTSALKIDYYRLPITDHLKPLDTIVDEFVSFIKCLPKESWLHFHCSAGKGRSSTVLTMLDMMRHPKQISFEEFIIRQINFGGINLLGLSPGKDWKHGYVRERATFLHHFLRYCQEQSPSFVQSWSAWKASNFKLLGEEFDN
jgi:protein-tyrosine phosphatase